MAGNQLSAKRVVSATLTASTVDFIFLTESAQAIQVTNLTGTAPIYFTVSHPGGSAPVPTIGGNGCYCAASVAGAAVPVRHDGMYGTIVQLISTGTPTYSVEVASRQVNI
jgi:hypothetical protein